MNTQEQILGLIFCPISLPFSLPQNEFQKRELSSSLLIIESKISPKESHNTLGCYYNHPPRFIDRNWSGEICQWLLIAAWWWVLGASFHRAVPHTSEGPLGSTKNTPSRCQISLTDALLSITLFCLITFQCGFLNFIFTVSLCTFIFEVIQNFVSYKILIIFFPSSFDLVFITMALVVTVMSNERIFHCSTPFGMTFELRKLGALSYPP